MFGTKNSLVAVEELKFVSQKTKIFSSLSAAFTFVTAYPITDRVIEYTLLRIMPH